ncbi:glycoside hydrolase TIM-barrel-like domain-containing protein [Boseongicola sp. H5]|uniref:baseplate multidomain protein megatron n=1 Tax=Boseongicola sp. H5 TaxID=2763261 RepID=UPI001D0A0BDA|nr:glycoside hydrolase TIM-barrel-like domain-containing protein [Boseongicola sp. H5]
MATIVLSAVGAAIGGAAGTGTFLGLTGAVVGRAVGATLGRVIDQRLLGSGSDPVEVGRVERFRLTGANEGSPIAQLFGRMRLGGQVIWSTQFLETVTRSGGGKGAPSQPETTSYSYSISLAMALCEGEISRVGRVWADGVQLSRDEITMRVYRGTEDQMPDPKMEAVEGACTVPAYRGIAYVVIEDLPLAQFGNRVPQLSFEVIRPAQPAAQPFLPAVSEAVQAVALMPGTGEYALARSRLSYRGAVGSSEAVNVNTPGGESDLEVSLEALRGELPNVGSVSLIVGWFGDDLRASQCQIKPKVENTSRDAAEMPWRVSSVTRGAAEEVARLDDRPVYGGTPADASVIQAIEAIHAGGQHVVFYPFLLMEILSGNGLPDPWSDNADQPVLPWRGRITGDKAPGQPGSADKTAANRAAVAAFFGNAQVSDFTISGSTVTYSGPEDWGYRRFILHYAALCAAAGGVEAFCIGTEMRALTQMRDEFGFPAVDAFRALAADVRSLLPDAKLSYAADWSEYFGYHPQDGSHDVYFHLDPLWADENIDFIAIDNYMPLSDWRDGPDHADVAWGSIYNTDYLRANVAGGEGHDWYYASSEGRVAQRRLPIEDGSTGLSLSGFLETMAPGVSGSFAVAYRQETVVFSGQVRFPDTAVEATLWEAGAAGFGAWMGVRDAGATFRLRAGDGSSAKTASDTGTVVLDLATDLLPFDGLIHELVWELRPVAPGHVKLWIDGRLVGMSSISDGSGMLGGYWAGAADTRWTGPIDPANVTRGEPVAPWPETDAGELSIYEAVSDGPTNAPWVYRYKAIREWWASPHADRRGGYQLATPSPWVPKSKPIWFTEFGCGAVDKGSNQPNKFLDPKSSETALPYFSDGRRDDLIQAQYLRATIAYWSDPANNPVSPIYGAPMVDLSKAHVWAWDARPWPAFPNKRDIWSDGENYGRGHWITGRVSGQPLAMVVAEICEKAGVTDYDVSGLFGFVRGHVSSDIETARARLQPLMLAYGFGAVERDGKLHFLHLPLLPDGEILAETTAVDEDGAAGLRLTRAPEAETVGRVRLGYTEADGAFETRVAEAIFPDDDDIGVSQSELPLALTLAEGRGIAERWLAEARVARDTVSFDLPPSRRDLGAGAMIALEDGSSWRIDRVEDIGARRIEAVRVERSLAEPSDATDEAVPQQAFVPPLPVSPVFMDLPLLSGDEVEHAPHLAVAAKPWPGSVALYSSSSSNGYTLNRLIEAGAVIGTLETPLFAASAGLWDRGAPFSVRIASGGGLSSTDREAVLNGANVAAIGAGDEGPWEVVQFADAELVGTGLWEISMRLRGQVGSDGVMPDVWPPGSLFVLLDGRPQQIDLAVLARGLARYYRVGPARRALDDASYQERVLAFDGVGLRPYAPAHLRARAGTGGLEVTWIRRTRVDGDTWQGTEVPLGEDAETYLVQVRDAGGLKREVTVSQPGWIYDDAVRGSDGTVAPYSIDVAQVSGRFGPGPFTRIMIDD